MTSYTARKLGPLMFTTMTSTLFCHPSMGKRFGIGFKDGKFGSYLRIGKTLYMLYQPLPLL